MTHIQLFAMLSQVPSPTPDAAQNLTDAIPYSIGLVIVCVVLLLLLWLPDMIRRD